MRWSPDADVVVHLAFIIMGSREESRRINLAGTCNGTVSIEPAATGQTTKAIYPAAGFALLTLRFR
jgi:UDP-glucose 4-epimerase